MTRKKQVCLFSLSCLGWCLKCCRWPIKEIKSLNLIWNLLTFALIKLEFYSELSRVYLITPRVCLSCPNCSVKRTSMRIYSLCLTSDPLLFWLLKELYPPLFIWYTSWLFSLSMLSLRFCLEKVCCYITLDGFLPLPSVCRAFLEFTLFMDCLCLLLWLKKFCICFYESLL